MSTISLINLKGFLRNDSPSKKKSFNRNMKKTIGSIKVNENTIINMKSAIEKYNSSSLFPVSEAEFRRMAIELLSQLILQDKDIPLKIVTK